MTTRKLRSSKRGLTFSVTPGAQYYPGSHYVYEVRKNCIIIRPAETGMKVSRKKAGLKEKALFDIRNKEVRDAVSSCSYMEMEVQENRILIRCIREIKSKIVSLEKILGEFCLSKTTLSAAVGIEGQISIDEYLASMKNTDDTLKTDLKQVFSVMSLFSGAGMLDWPFHQDPDFEIRYACDYDAGACESYRHNIGEHIFCGDVREVHGYGDQYNLIIGGPSCKPFSASNRRKMVEQHEDVDLVNEYIRITQENNPEIFVIENVPQFLTCHDGMYLNRVMNSLGKEYKINAAIIKDSDIGGYTSRKRTILIGSRIGDIKLMQSLLHPVRTVKQALQKVTPEWFNYSDLTKSGADTVRRMSYVRQGHNFKDIPEMRDNPKTHSDRYYRLDPDGISPTIVNWRKLPLIHPTENRTLSVAEASALMGFGKEFEFHGSIASRQQQCGNGCTYAIGKLIKDTVKKALLAYHGASMSALGV